MALFRFPQLLIQLGILLFCALLGSAVAAQEPLRGVLSGRPVEGYVLQPAPSTLRFTIDSELNTRLRPIAESVLGHHGFPVRAAAPLEIEIKTDLQTRRPAQRIGLSANAGGSSPGDVSSPLTKSVMADSI